MEWCIEARALKKSSFLSEFAFNYATSQQKAFLIDELNNGNCNVVDDFSVDVFLDLSNGDNLTEEFVKEEEEDSLSSTSSSSQEIHGEKFHATGGSVTAGELSVPVDDLENLEWLSQFVDDSASELSLLCPAGNNCLGKTGTTGSFNRNEPPVCTTTPVLCFPSTVPAKARTKRPRTGGRSWSGSSPESSCEYSYSNHVHIGNFADEVVKPKGGKKRAAIVTYENCEEKAAAPLLNQRRCSHCLVQKTPQWRNGPLGPKTLCNACGVRFKSGRLFPEYRPACSPTFSGVLHSNSHRKVLEMRKKKESTTGLGDVEPSLV